MRRYNSVHLLDEVPRALALLVQALRQDNRQELLPLRSQRSPVV